MAFLHRRTRFGIRNFEFKRERLVRDQAMIKEANSVGYRQPDRLKHGVALSLRLIIDAGAECGILAHANDVAQTGYSVKLSQAYKAIQDPFAPGFLKLDFQLVALDRVDDAVAEFAVEDALADG